MDPGGIINTISKRPELYQHGSVTLLGSTDANNKSGADGTFDITGPIGSNGLAYRLSVMASVRITGVITAATRKR